ncbi:MAG: hypothetical protein AB7K67_04885 [Hyphomicrobiaceae bacterium]
MTARSLFMGAVTAVAMTAGALSANAAPAGGLTGIKPATPAAQPVAYRACWWEYGVRHCEWRGGPRYYNGYGYGYRSEGGPRDPDAYRTGSSRWWREMDREDRGGNNSR